MENRIYTFSHPTEYFMFISIYSLGTSYLTSFYAIRKTKITDSNRADTAPHTIQTANDNSPILIVLIGPSIEHAL